MTASPIAVQTPREDRLARLEQEVQELKRAHGQAAQPEAVSIVCFSGDWDRLFAAFTIATGALALGRQVHMFFTFWGATALRDAKGFKRARRSWLQRLLGWALPRNIGQAPLSKMNAGGLGKIMLAQIMRKHGVEDLGKLVDEAIGMGVQIHCCETSMRLFGWGNDELISDAQSRWCGVSTFLGFACNSRVTLFI